MVNRGGKGGYWRRPTARTYAYNLEVGEHYYQPMTSYLDAERGTRGETPGALTFDERLSRKWLYGRRYESTELRDRYSRASSLARDGGASASFLENEMAQRRAARAASEVATSATASAAASTRQQLIQQRQLAQQQAAERAEMSAQSVQASAQASKQQLITSAFSRQTTQQEQVRSQAQQTSIQQRQMRMQQEQQQQQTQRSRMAAARSSRQEQTQITESRRRIDDDICKKVADIRMSPWSPGQELDEAQAASARARLRILELEKELEEITRKAMTSQVRAVKTAKQMAAQATLEDEANMASSFKKSKKVMIESSSRIAA